MKRILQCIVWITVITASGRTERGYSYSYLQNPRAITFPDTRLYFDQSRNRQTSHLHPELQDPRRQKIQSRLSEPELAWPENGYRVQLSKRGGHRKHYITKLFLELFAALGALEAEVSSYVVFPGPTSKSRLEPEISEECMNKGYCKRIPNYPKEYVRELLDSHGDDIKQRFQMDELDASDVQIAQRFGSPGDALKLCSSKEEILVPDSLPDRNGKWWTILQDRDNNMTQGFRAETCTNRGSKCSDIVSYQRGYSHVCEQKFVLRTVLIVNETRAIAQKQLRLPSCCFCMITTTTL